MRSDTNVSVGKTNIDISFSSSSSSCTFTAFPRYRRPFPARDCQQQETRVTSYGPVGDINKA
jgi:hypothetical protein